MWKEHGCKGRPCCTRQRRKDSREGSGGDLPCSPGLVSNVSVLHLEFLQNSDEACDVARLVSNDAIAEEDNEGEYFWKDKVSALIIQILSEHATV